MADEFMNKLRELEQRVRKGFSALNFMLNGLSSRVEGVESSQKDATRKIDEIENDIAEVKERLAKLEGHREGVRDGREDSVQTITAIKEVQQGHQEEKKLGVETWKATAPIIIAVVTGIFGLVTGVLALLQAIFGHGGH